MKLCEALQVKCLEFYEQVVAFTFLRKKEETISVASCLGAESDQSAIKLASELLNLNHEQSMPLVARVLLDAGIDSTNEDIELRNKLQCVVSAYE